MNSMKKLTLHSLFAVLLSSNIVQASIDDALHDMFVAVEKMQEEFSKIGDKINDDIQRLQGSFSSSNNNNNFLTITPHDTEVILSIKIDDLDKDSIKAVVHNNVLMVSARTKQKEMELVVEKNSIEMNIQQRIEHKSDDSIGKQQKMSASYSSQRSLQTLAVPVNVNEVSVEYENGVLTIKLARFEPVQQPKIITVIKK